MKVYYWKIDPSADKKTPAAVVANDHVARLQGYGALGVVVSLPNDPAVYLAVREGYGINVMGGILPAASIVLDDVADDGIYAALYAHLELDKPAADVISASSSVEPAASTSSPAADEPRKEAGRPQNAETADYPYQVVEIRHTLTLDSARFLEGVVYEALRRYMEHETELGAAHREKLGEIEAGKNEALTKAVGKTVRELKAMWETSSGAEKKNDPVA